MANYAFSRPAASLPRGASKCSGAPLGFWCRGVRCRTDGRGPQPAQLMPACRVAIVAVAGRCASERSTPASTGHRTIRASSHVSRALRSGGQHPELAQRQSSSRSMQACVHRQFSIIHIDARRQVRTFFRGLSLRDEMLHRPYQIW